MPSRTKTILNSARILLLGAPLVLAACANDFGPFPMPSGYANHDKPYQAPPGPEPVLKKLQHMKVAHSVKGSDNCPPGQAMPMAQSDMMMSMPAGAAWNDAAHDLLTRLIDGFGRPAEPVYIDSPVSMTQNDMNLEKALRSEMMAAGIEAAPAPGKGPFVLHYSFSPVSGADASRMMVTIMLHGENNSVLQEVSGIYSLGGGMAAPMEPMTMSAPQPYDPAPMPAPESGPMPIGPLN